MKCNIRIICPECGKMQRVEVECIGEKMRFIDVKHECVNCGAKLIVYDSEGV